MFKMKHFLLKFNHGVEIGANLAYQGHYQATQDETVRVISEDEVVHKLAIAMYLKDLGEVPSPLIDGTFTYIGSIIKWACQYSPRWALNWVASSMELFAVFSYGLVAKRYPDKADMFNQMADQEEKHRLYFKGVS